jgi:hypothetical protein
MRDAAIRPDQPKVDPESLVLRAKPRGVTRFKRHVVIGIAAIVAVAVSVAAWLALSAPALHVTTNGDGTLQCRSQAARRRPRVASRDL